MTARRPAGGAGTRLVALLGDPVEHSVSPVIHMAGFTAHGLDLAYLAFRVAPADLADAVKGLWALGAVGANVTVPHKEVVVALCASASDAVRATGSANTLVRGAGGWHAETTDGAGFLAPLDRDAFAGTEVVVLGAGGAARAVAHAALTALAPRVVTVVARRATQAEAVVEALAPWAGDAALQAIAWPDASPAVRAATLIVNTTPVGTGDASATPWPDTGDFHAGQTVYDLVYRPAETRLMELARRAGAAVVGGLPMLVAQAAASFRLWTGRDLPLAAARAAALRALAER